MRGALEASKLLRPGLLEGVSVLVAGSPPGDQPPQAAGASLSEAVGSACEQLGAEVSSWDPERIPPATDMLVIDGAELFAQAHAGATRGSKRTPAAARDALAACMDVAWEVTRAVVNAAFLPAARGGRIVYLAPAPDAGAHADAARAALDNLARTLSIEWARYGVTLVTIAPGAATSSCELAALSAYLASPAGAYFSGCQLDLRDT